MSDLELDEIDASDADIRSSLDQVDDMIVDMVKKNPTGAQHYCKSFGF
jgi:hypothetical protein